MFARSLWLTSALFITFYVFLRFSKSIKTWLFTLFCFVAYVFSNYDTKRSAPIIYCFMTEFLNTVNQYRLSPPSITDLAAKHFCGVCIRSKLCIMRWRRRFAQQATTSMMSKRPRIIVLQLHLSPVSTTRVDGPSWRPELSVSITRQHGPCWRARVSTSRVDGPGRQHGNRSPINSGS